MVLTHAVLEEDISAPPGADTTLDVVDYLPAFQKKFPSTEAFTAQMRRLVLDIEDRMSAQLTEILEAPKFKTLEARWMGLASIVWSKPNVSNIKIKILDCSWEELCRDLHYTSEIRRSRLYTLIGHEQLDTLGGEPFGIAMIDHDLSMSLDTEYDDLYTAQLICSMGESCMCPFIMSAGPDFFGESDAAWFTDARRITSILRGEEYRAWQMLREAPNARFLGLVMPQTQLRGRYEDADIGFRFHQWPSESDGLWGSGCYDFLRTALAEFHRCAWFGFLKMVSNEAGIGAVVAPTVHPIPAACERSARARTRMTRNLAHIYSDQGFIALAESTKNNMLYFVGNRSVTDCKGIPEREVISQLQSVMVACRIVHYVKVQIRALIGQVKTAAECESILNAWFDPYVSPSASSPEVQVKYPLQRASVRVKEAISDAARFQCEIHVSPQYQIDTVMGEIELKTDFGSGQLRRES